MNTWHEVKRSRFRTRYVRLLKLTFVGSTALTAAATLICATASAAQSAVRSPLELTQQAQRFSHTGVKSPACLPIPSALPAALDQLKYYVDKQNSIIDPALFEAQRQRDAELRAALEALAVQTQALVVATPASRQGIANCLAGYLRKFAHDDTFNATTHFRGTGAVRLYAAGPFFAYVVAHQLDIVPAADDGDIRAWIAHLAENILRYEKSFPYHNNISYWAGASLALAAVALNEPRYLDAAVEIARQAARDVSSNDVMPAELARGVRAMEYQLFALEAVSVIGFVAHANGIEIAQENNAALLRVMKTVKDALHDPQPLIALGVAPAAFSPDYVYAQNMGWLLFYRLMTGDTSADKLVCGFRSLYTFRAGGDWFQLFGDPSWCQ